MTRRKNNKYAIKTKNVDETGDDEMSVMRSLDIEDIRFRLSLPTAMTCISYYMPSQRAIKQIKDAHNWRPNRLKDISCTAAQMGLLTINGDTYIPTQIGNDLVSSYGTPEFKTRAYEYFKNGDARFKYVWTVVGIKMGDGFTRKDLGHLFLDMAESFGAQWALNTTKGYAGNFLTWAKAAGVCKIEYKKYRIIEKFHELYILPSEPEPEKFQDDVRPVEVVANKSEYKDSLIELNLIIADFLADETKDEDLIEIEMLLEKLRSYKMVDNLIIDMLEDEIKMAVTSQDNNAKKLIGKSLKKLREHYFKKASRGEQ